MIAVLVVLRGSQHDEVLLIRIVWLGRGIQEGILQVVVVCSHSGADR